MALTVKQIERETVVGRYFDGVGDGMVLTIRSHSFYISSIPCP